MFSARWRKWTIIYSAIYAVRLASSSDEGTQKCRFSIVVGRYYKYKTIVYKSWNISLKSLFDIAHAENYNREKWITLRAVYSYLLTEQYKRQFNQISAVMELAVNNGCFGGYNAILQDSFNIC